jgi:hypothetical protein
MRHHFKFTPIKTRDVHAIMKAIRTCGTLSGIAYCRLHNYIVTLERLLGEGAARPEDSEIVLTRQEEMFLNN